MTYRGRFAPSPTGDLHFGSLVAALASYLDAKAHDGLWLVRIEDIDPPREQAGAKNSIISSLHAHGMDFDGDISYQSDNGHRYEEILQQLQASNLTFKCPCSRTFLNENHGVHQEACRQQILNPKLSHAIKLKPSMQWYTWRDRVQGFCGKYLNDSFVLKRKDQLYAYQLAVVVDDIHSGINHVVRGADLLESTPMQLALYAALEHQAPSYSHIPVILDRDNQKLSKQQCAIALQNNHARTNLVLAMHALQITIPDNLDSVTKILNFAINNWNVQRLPAALEAAHSTYTIE